MGRLMWCYQLLCLQLVLLHSLSCANLCSHDESSALLHFKQLFSFLELASYYPSCVTQLHYPKMKHWKEDTDCCSWDGITCDRVTGYVVGLDLSCSWLFGTIPSNTSLFLLSHLQKLNLAYNFFHPSQIPSDFVRFPSLTHLNLTSSGFFGQVPFEISHLSKLIILDLSSNDLTLETLVMKGLVQNMSHLQELSLGSGNSYGYAVNMSTVTLGTLTNINLPSLIYLSLADCELQGSFPDIFINLTQLHTLDLSHNSFDGTIPSGLFSLPSLESISLGGNKLSSTIPSSIFELVNLTTLDLSSNSLSGTVELYMFAKLKNLRYLDLSPTILSISTTIKVNSSFPKLHYLSLAACNISEFPEILSTANNLQYLDLSSNKIHGRIPNWLFSIPSLETIYLADNQLSGPIPSGLFSLPSLEIIYLSNNQLSGPIPSGLFSLPSLEIISVAYNQLSGRIPSSIFELVNLTRLDLSSNNLSGTVELSMFAKLKNLKDLDLSHNSLSMSSTIKVNSSFPKLNRLFLSSCDINEFPEIFSTADNLQLLDLSDNKIHGHIPNWLFNMSTLFHLNLSHNFLTGGIEQLQWKGLQYLDLQSNLLQGLLPASPPPQPFSFLELFSISHNNMTGAIPSSFCNLSSIEYLLLSNNSLYGRVPQCLGNYTNILVLDLSMNNFHGNIPQTLANGSLLTTLNLNGNRFEGSLPPSLVNCVILQVLDLGNNMINDTFPHWLATLQQLQVLILRSNRFYGPLDNSRKRLPFSKLRILDLSLNGFSGPLPRSFFEDFEAMMSGKNNSAEMRYMGDMYYRDSVVVTMKGIETKMERILTIFTTMDLSCNKFRGRIPDVVGKMNSLIVLNFSHNSLTGRIPVSLENLTELESLDLSSNRLEGKIPTQLTSLTYLSVMNLSYNQLAGPIPDGKQFNTFENNSYIGNMGLCGLPLLEKCNNGEAPESKPTIFQEDEDAWSWFDWKIITMGYGSGLVIGLSMGYIVFSTGKPLWFVSLVERKAIKLSERCKRRRN